MVISITTKKKSLTTFSTELNKKPQFTVQFYINDRSKKYYISTSYRTSDINFSGVFHDKENTAKYNQLLTDNLLATYRQMTEYGERHKEMSVDRMKEELTVIVKGASARKGKHTLADLIAALAETKETEGTKLVWRGASKKVREFDAEATLESVGTDWLERFDKWMMIGKGLAMNTRSIQMRVLRALFNWAMDGEKIFSNPFRKFKIKEERTTHLLLSAQQIADFRDYPCEDWQRIYRDIAMLSFYLGGINIGDLLLHESLDINDRFVFNRKKTDVRVDLPVCDEAMEIINKYRGKKYLLGILGKKVSSYKTFNQHLLKGIKTIGYRRLVKDKVGKLRKVDYHPMFNGINMYTFRYSFATLAANIEGVSVEDVGRCLGHAWALGGNVTAERYIINTTMRTDKTFQKVMEIMRGLKGRSKEEIDAEIKKRDGLA